MENEDIMMAGVIKITQGGKTSIVHNSILRDGKRLVRQKTFGINGNDDATKPLMDYEFYGIALYARADAVMENESAAIPDADKSIIVKKADMKYEGKSNGDNDIIEAFTIDDLAFNDYIGRLDYADSISIIFAKKGTEGINAGNAILFSRAAMDPIPLVSDGEMTIEYSVYF